MKWGLASSSASDVPREIAWYADVRGIDPAVWQHSVMGIGHEIISPHTAVSSRASCQLLAKDVHLVLVYLLGIMHQSFVTIATAPMGLGNSGNIDFPLCKARVYVQQCGDISMFKALLESRLVILKLARPVWT